MSAETERHELYEIAKHEVGDRFAELMMKHLPPTIEALATKDDLAVVRADLAVLEAHLRADLAELREELRVEMRDLTSGQTRTHLLGLVGSVTALAVTQLVVAAIS